jgi:enamine deaminase RidA (YjgF/YER057c/UK114 family)
MHSTSHSSSIDPIDTLLPEERLRALGIELPPAAAAVGDYAPTVTTGNLLMTSGQLPWIAGDLKFKGKIGKELNVEQGYQAFRLSALNAIAQLRAALGSLHRVKQIVRLEGTMASPSSRRCSTAPRTSSTRYSVHAGVTPGWSIRIMKCRWIVRRSLSYTPRSCRTATARRVLAQRSGHDRCVG